MRRSLLTYFRYHHYGLCRRALRPCKPCIHAASLCNNSRCNKLCLLHPGWPYPECPDLLGSGCRIDPRRAVYPASGYIKKEGVSQIVQKSRGRAKSLPRDFVFRPAPSPAGPAWDYVVHLRRWKLLSLPCNKTALHVGAFLLRTALPLAPASPTYMPPASYSRIY